MIKQKSTKNMTRAEIIAEVQDAINDDFYSWVSRMDRAVENAFEEKKENK